MITFIILVNHSLILLSLCFSGATVKVTDFAFPRPDTSPLYAAETSRLSEAPSMKYKVEEAPNFTATLRDKTVPEFSHVHFMCSVTGLPAPKISWQKDGKDVSNNSNFFISVSCHLIILWLIFYDDHYL